VARYPAVNGSPSGNPDRHYELPTHDGVLAVDESGYIYVHSQANTTLYRFDAKLNLLASWSPVSSLSFLYTVTQGYLLVQSTLSTVAIYTLPSEGGSLTREDYVARGLARYRRSWERKLLLGIYVVPFLIMAALLVLAQSGLTP
jgi:hypothetical protein